MAAHSSILAWRILWTEKSGGLLSMGSQRVGHDKRLSTAQGSIPLNIQCKHSQSEQPLDPTLFNYKDINYFTCLGF